MIRRRDNPQIVIAQTAHSWLAGQLAMYWGNEAFRFPARSQDVILAAINHDQGWRDWEQTPEIDSRQRPIDFMEMPLPTHLDIWRQSINGLVNQSRYAALLVSRHARFLVGLRLAQDFDPEPDQALMREFCARQEQWEGKTISTLQADPHFAGGCLPKNLAANTRLLQIFDWLSLLLCMDALTESVVEDAPGQTVDRRVDIRLTPTGEQSLTLRPWPFSCPRLEVTVQTRHLPKATFESNEDLQLAWQQAEVKPRTWRVSQ